MKHLMIRRLLNNELNIYGNKRSWPILRYRHGICLKGLRRVKRDLSQDSQLTGRDSNRVDAPLFAQTDAQLSDGAT
jgi:hypothetical protein